MNTFAIFGAICIFFFAMANANYAFCEMLISEESEITMPPSESSEIGQNRLGGLKCFRRTTGLSFLFSFVSGIVPDKLHVGARFFYPNSGIFAVQLIDH